MIDLLAQPTACTLVMELRGFRMEVGKGLVYLDVGLLDYVLIRPEFVVVKVDMVHENKKNLKLEATPDDMTITLQNAVYRRV